MVKCSTYRYVMRCSCTCSTCTCTVGSPTGILVGIPIQLCTCIIRTRTRTPMCTTFNLILVGETRADDRIRVIVLARPVRARLRFGTREALRCWVLSHFAEAAAVRESPVPFVTCQEVVVAVQSLRWPLPRSRPARLRYGARPRTHRCTRFCSIRVATPATRCSPTAPSAR